MALALAYLPAMVTIGLTASSLTNSAVPRMRRTVVVVFFQHRDDAVLDLEDEIDERGGDDGEQHDGDASSTGP